MPEVLEYVRSSHEAERGFHHDRMMAVQLEINDINGKLNRLTDLLTDGHVTEETYKQRDLELGLRRRNLNVDSIANDFKMAISGIVAILSKSPQLFQSSNIAEKRALLGFIFSNLQLKGPSLGFSLRNPLDQFVDIANCQLWCSLVGVARTHFRQDALNLYSFFPVEPQDWLKEALIAIAPHPDDKRTQPAAQGIHVEQLVDLKTAYAGKITGIQYFRKWMAGSLP